MAQVALLLRVSHGSDIEHRGSMWQRQQTTLKLGFRACAEEIHIKWDTLNNH